MQPTDPTPSVSVQPDVQPEVQTSAISDPTPIDWKSELFGGQPADVPQQQTQPETQPATVETQPEVTTPPDAQAAEPPATDPAAQPEAPEDVAATEADQALYDSIAAELKSQYPTADPILLKRMIDDKFMVKQLLSKDEKKSKQISQLLKRVTKKEPAARVVTEFERSLLPPSEPQAQPQIPQATVQPQVVQQPAQPQQPQYTVPPHLNWGSEQDAADAESRAWEDMADTGASEERRSEAATRWAQIRTKQTALAFQPILNELPGLIEAKARQIIESQFGDILPAMRQTAADRQAEASHAFAVAELEKAGMGGIREMVKPTGTEPLIVDGKEYDNTPLNAAMMQFPFINKINVTHAPDGRPYQPVVAERLTRIERYRAAAEAWGMMQQTAPAPQTPPPVAVQPQTGTAAVQQAFQAGVASANRSEADRARQAMNSGPGATTSATGAAQPSLTDEYRNSGPVNFNQLLFGRPK